MTNPDELALADAVNRLERAVSNLTGPTLLPGNTLGPSVWQQVHDSLTDRRASKGGGRARGSSPVWLEGMAWCDTVDRDAVDWCRHAPWRDDNSPAAPADTVARLRWLAEEKPRPQDAEWCLTITARIDHLANQARQLLDPVVLTIDAPCPSCGADHVRLPDGTGDMVRHPALRVRLQSADCAACGTVWTESEMLELAEQVTRAGV